MSWTRELFKLTVERAAAAAPRAPREENILIVDDSPTFLNALSATLRMDGHYVTGVYWGEDVVALARRERFDCVLIDLGMPRLNGLQTCRRLRALPGMAEVPIAVMTDSPSASLHA